MNDSINIILMSSSVFKAEEDLRFLISKMSSMFRDINSNGRGLYSSKQRLSPSYLSLIAV